MKNKKKQDVKVLLIPIPNELVVSVVTSWREEDVAELKNRIFRNCRKYLSYEDAQEATQETLYGIAKGQDKLKDIVEQFKSESTGKKKQSPGGYVTQINRNQIVNTWRAKGRQKEFQTGISRDAKENPHYFEEPCSSFDEIVDKVAASPTSENHPEARANSRELREILCDIREEAPSIERNEIDAFLYQQSDGMSIAEIAQKMGVKEGTVKSWIFRGKMYLRQEILKRGYRR
jgi:RNA polymerase sigma factor (sigma-70 family)